MIPNRECGLHNSDMYFKTKALILREVRYKEADRMLTLFSDTRGKLSAKARGALRKGSRICAATQQLTYSELTVFENRGRLTVNEAEVLEPFSGLREDIAKFSLGCYFAECLESFGVEDQAEPALLQLGLNALYALSNGLCPPEQVKAAFELRLMCIAGYEPNLSCCAECGAETPNELVLGIGDGTLYCRSCRKVSDGSFALLTAGALSASRYITSAPPKQFLSFSVDEPDLKCLERTWEKYTFEHSERKFSTLDYWKKVR